MSDHSITKMIPTDVGHILLFHPDDLQYTAGWPLGWYSVPHAWAAATSQGHLVAWSTRADGSFKVRLTTGSLSERETDYVRQVWDFPYTVSKCRVFLDNSDTLPGESRMTAPEENPDYWFELPNGTYVARVSALHWDAEPGAGSEGFDALPNYVVQFMPANGTRPALARRPPDLTGETGEAASDEVFDGSDFPVRDRLAGFDFSMPLPGAQCAQIAITGASFSSQDEAEFEALLSDPDDTFALFDMKFVLGPKLAVGELAHVCEMHGSGGSPDRAPRYEFRCLGLVRIVSVGKPWPSLRPRSPAPSPVFSLFGKSKLPPPPAAAGLFEIRCAPVLSSSLSIVGIDVAGFKARVLAALRSESPLAACVAPAASYWALYIDSRIDLAPILQFALQYTPMPPAERLRLEMADTASRVAGLVHSLSAGGPMN